MRKSSFIVEAGFRIAIFRELVSYLGPVSDSLIVPILVAFILDALATLQNWMTRLLSLLGVQQGRTM
ncbi:MAG: hypothetical protein OXG49_16875 [Chloroflexi bacterium]|nr:hypothetical protein [Chloroflexota bacterium]